MSMPELRTIVIDEHLDVRGRIEQLKIWQQEVECEATQIERLRQLDASRLAESQVVGWPVRRG